MKTNYLYSTAIYLEPQFLKDSEGLGGVTYNGPEMAGPVIPIIIGFVAQSVAPLVSSAIVGALGGSAVLGGFVTAAINVGVAVGVGAIGGGIGSVLTGHQFGQGLLPGAVSGLTAGLGHLAFPGAPAAGQAGSAGAPAAAGAVTANVAGAVAPVAPGVGASGAATGIGAALGGTAPQVASTASQLGIGAQTMNAIRALPGNLAQQFLGTPQGMANLAQLLLAGTAKSPSLAGVQAAFNQENSQNQALFGQRMQLAQTILNNAAKSDPENAGNEAQANSNSSFAASTNQAVHTAGLTHGYNTGQMKSMVRQAGLEGARSGTQAFTNAYNGALGAQNSAYSTANSVLPGSAPSSYNQAVGLYNIRSQNANADAAGIGRAINAVFQPSQTPKVDNLWGTPAWAPGG